MPKKKSSRPLAAAPGFGTGKSAKTARGAGKGHGASSKLVFISFHPADREWRDRIEQNVIRALPAVESWDESRADAGTGDAVAAGAAINRAAVAVVLLSPDYVESAEKRGELHMLLVRAREGRLTLLTVAVREARWRDLPYLEETNIWCAERPLDTQAPDELDLGFAQMTEALRTILQSGAALPPAGNAPRKSPPTDIPPPRYPLVFISASHKDREWREQLKRTFNEEKAPIECWDDSRIFTGADWPAETARAIQRATVALVLLSPDYINSKTARSELNQLLAASRSGFPRLFPIIVRPCAWQDIPEIRNIKIWDWARPLDQFPPEHLNEVFRTITRDLLYLIATGQRSDGAPNAKTPPPALVELQFSHKSEIVLQRAIELAKASGRAGVTPGSVLFAFAEVSGTRETDTARFVRQAFDATGRYQEEFEQYNKAFAATPRETFEDDGGWTPTVGRHLGVLLNDAADIAGRVTGGNREIHLRHLFAALIARDEGPTTTKRLRKLVGDLPAFRRQFREFVRATSPTDNQVEWDRIFAPGAAAESARTAPPPFRSGPAGYNSEFCGVGGSHKVDDCLNVKDYAHRIADLIALRETKLPLAVGLFGNWGSGKTHFMNLIDRRLKDRCDEQREPMGNGAAAQWCREIVPVYFNAWHYLDANLWASLVSQIFESLFVHLRPKEDALKQVQARLEQACGATARAAEELAVAEVETKKARAELEAAEEAHRQREGALGGMLHGIRGLRALLPDVSPTALKQHAAELLGVEKELKTLDDLQAVVAEARQTGVGARSLLNRFMAPGGRAWRIGWLAATVIGGAALSYLIARYAGDVLGRLRALGSIIAALTPAAAAFVAWSRPALARARAGLAAMESWQQRAEDAHAAARRTPQVLDAERKATEAAARENDARVRLTESQQREKSLREEAESLSPERRLGRFIEQRAQSGDYKSQLGLISLARRDFAELSNLFAETDSSAPRPADAKLRDCVDRIVLFVDDLDRCQPDKVVEVLQAVHLLLAFPLFAVVVGVDQRCLRQSLRTQFKGLVRDTADNGQPPGTGIERDERPATPLDYLEKVFHVPFHLPAMQKEGYEGLIRRLTESVEATTDIPDQTEVTESDEATEEELGLSQGTLTAVPVNVILAPVVTETAKPQAAEAGPPKSQPSPSPVPDPPPVPDPVVGSVPLEDWERKALENFHALIRTPRGTTRFLNTYRLVRAGLPEAEWGTFHGDGAGEYRVAMLLLAAAAGHPAVARDWFDRLRAQGPDAFTPSDEDDPAWSKFRDAHAATFNGTAPLTPEQVAKWLPRVERFAF